VIYIAPIVEGHGEVEAVPVLLRRIVQAEAPQHQLRINPPIRIKSGSFLNKESDFNRYVTLAASKAAQSAGLVLILLDCEDDCPAILGPELLARAQSVRGDVPYLIVLAYREYESWFLAAARSLRGLSGLPDNLITPDNVEAIRNAKGWLSERMTRSYDPIKHQAEISGKFDLHEARGSASFDRFYRRIVEYITGLP
jgi:hypothetical protein